MAVYSVPPFPLGETLKGTDDDGNLINGHWLGQCFKIPANQFPSAPTTNLARQTGKPLCVVVLRNESGIALLPKRVARLKRSAGFSLQEAVDGYADSLAEKEIVIIDEYLDSSGVADDDIFLGVYNGPVTCVTGNTGASFNGDIAVGDQLVAGTAATTQGTASGRISNVTMTATGASAAFNQAANLVGRAMSARTTGETGADILVDACIQL